MSEEHIGDWIQTYTGRRFWIMDPDPADVDINDIAHSLSLQCRFNGHCSQFYSIAQHSVLVALEIKRQYDDNGGCLSSTHWATVLWGLLHDAAEAYVGDMVRPLKRSMPGFVAAEDQVLRAIMKHIGLDHYFGLQPMRVKEVDDILLATEKRDLHLVQREWELCQKPLAEKIVPQDSYSAKRSFLHLYYELASRLNEIRRLEGLTATGLVFPVFAGVPEDRYAKKRFYGPGVLCDEPFGFSDRCDRCDEPQAPNADCFFVSSGGWDSREGQYICWKCQSVPPPCVTYGDEAARHSGALCPDCEG